MKRRTALKITHTCHSVCPSEWKRIPVVSGDYDLDATILHRTNKDLPSRLDLYTRKGGPAYGAKTGYSGYGSGDD